MIVLLSGTGLADEIKPCKINNTLDYWWANQYVEWITTVIDPAIAASRACAYPYHDLAGERGYCYGGGLRPEDTDVVWTDRFILSGRGASTWVILLYFYMGATRMGLHVGSEVSQLLVLYVRLYDAFVM